MTDEIIEEPPIAKDTNLERAFWLLVVVLALLFFILVSSSQQVIWKG